MRHHQGIYQRRDERRRKFHITAQCLTKIIVLPYWPRTQARSHTITGIQLINEGL